MGFAKVVLNNAIGKHNIVSFVQRNLATKTSTVGWNMDDYRFFMPIQTRWSDNDEHGHINNSVYYQFIDAIVTNAYFSILEKSNLPRYPVVRAKTTCTFRKSLQSPQTPLAGTALSKLGASSMELLIGFFEPKSDSDDFLDELNFGFLGNFVNKQGRDSLKKHYNPHAVALGTAVAVHVSGDYSKSAVLPKEFVDAFNNLLKVIDE